LFRDSRVASLLKEGNRLFGFAFVVCPDCVQQRDFWVYIVWGKGGWFAPLPDIAPYVHVNTLFKAIPAIIRNPGLIDTIAPPKSRIEIRDWDQ